MENAKLIYGCDTNSFYATGLEMHDPYVWYQDTKGQTHIILSALEVERGRKNAHVNHVHASGDICQELKDAGTPQTMATIIAWLVDQNRPQTVEVPGDFTALMMKELSALGYHIKPMVGPFFAQRAIKTSEEIEKIRYCQQINEEAFRAAFEVFRKAKINKDATLKYKGELLTAEFIQGTMNSVLAGYGAVSFNGGPIVSCGAQGADPHERGHGVLTAHEFIIIDCFPMGGNFYNGDLTRTILKGTPTDWHLETYEAVKKAQQLGLDTIKAGVTGQAVHDAVDQSLIADGYTTGEDENGVPYGFFHGTGHAVGLDVHDDGPGISPRNTNPLEKNMVVTVEPGVYYPEKGGVRIEDIVAVTKNGIDNLTTLPKELVIK